MKNRIELKKVCMVLATAMLFFLLIGIVLLHSQYTVYTRNYNARLNAVIALLKERYPDLSTQEIMTVINQETTEADNIFKQYGIDIEKDSVIPENDTAHRSFLLIDLMVVSLFFVLFFLIFLFYENRQSRQIAELTRYMEALNRQDYRLEIDSNSEDELSILKNEIYKTTVFLKENAENSLRDKKNLKDSLSDISHQIKTPLTSILIMLDNMQDDPDMPPEVRADFVLSMKREITGLNFLVGAILKLSRFDANTVHFHIQPVFLSQLVQEAARNVSVLCDLREITVTIRGEEDAILNCDPKWQAEALSNILKDCVEHSPENSSIEISYLANKLSCIIIIKDHGCGIEADDLPHIFERFYRGKHATGDHVGIGLALAKSIIESAGGKIRVSSEVGVGTEFEIRYDRCEITTDTENL